jgi:DegT/DnrJ/EryC1/StrS aminotransferase family
MPADPLDPVPPLAVPGVGTAPAHPAADADRELLARLSRAAEWWASQRTWRVTSSHTGGGAIEAFETAVAAGVGPAARALALPSGTVALHTALSVLGLGPGDRVGVPAVDWTTSRAVVRAVGATAVPLPVDPATGLLDVHAADPGLAAVIAVHLHGLSCDIPALSRVLPGVPIVEDAARAWGARYPDGAPVGSAADACAFSFGEAKSPAAGELGCLVTNDLARHREAVRRTQHPTRQLLAGVEDPSGDQLMSRVAPVAALLGAHALHEHVAQVPALRTAAADLTRTFQAAGIQVLSNPCLHAPGVLAVQATPACVRALLGHPAPPAHAVPAALIVTAVDQPDTDVHPDFRPAPQLPALTIVTLAIAGS